LTEAPTRDTKLPSYLDLETEFTSWVFRSLTDVQAAWGGREFKVDVDNNGFIYLTSLLIPFNIHVYNLDTHLATYTSHTVDYPPFTQYASLAHKYFVFSAFPGLTWDINIMRRGVLLFTFDVLVNDPTMFDIPSYGISPNGRYLVLSTRNGVSNGVMMIYEGRP
jgi:hypothetical protein